MGQGGGADFGPFELDIGRLPGVTHARVVSERGRITEIHIVADGLKDPRALKRDIETLASAKYHLELDHRIISISTLPDVEIMPTRSGLELVSVSVTTASGIATCTVVVRRGDETAEGSSTGGATASGIPKIVARAVVDAVSKLLGYALPADVDNAFFTPVDDDLRIATVIIRFVEEDGSETPVPGSRPVRADQNEALARAVLDAVNRHFGM